MMYSRKPPAPGEGVSLTDRFGDTITISPSGGGYVLIEISNPEKDCPDCSVEIPGIDLIPLFTSAVDATGKTPTELKDDAIKSGLVRAKPSSRQVNRAERRKKRAKPATPAQTAQTAQPALTIPRNSFGVPLAKMFTNGR